MSDGRVVLKEVIFEITHMGNMVRIAAIDPITGTEVISVAPKSLGKAQWQRHAKRKLEYVMTKNKKAKKHKSSIDFNT